MRTLVIKHNHMIAKWKAAFSSYDLNIIDAESTHDKSKVDFALVWYPSRNWLASYPNLKIIFSLGAGVDHLMRENVVPEGVPVVRMVENHLTAGMVEFVVYYTLHFFRGMNQYQRFQRQKKWCPIEQKSASDLTVGVMGMGVLGCNVADCLLRFGFRVCGWSRTRKEIDQVESFAGDNELFNFLQECNILVCLLPLTQNTRFILNEKHLKHLPKNSYLINAGRGGHQVESDILRCLDNGQLSGVALDVFESEPLDVNSPLWSHPKVHVTPHIASMTMPEYSAEYIYKTMIDFLAGNPVDYVVDMKKEY